MATEVSQPAVGGERRSARTSAAPLRAWVRERVTTTPGRLAVISILVVLGAVCFGAIAEISEQAREQAASSAQTKTEPLLAQAVNLYASLSDANATATTTFLVGGLEPSGRRARYLSDVQAASDSLATLTRNLAGSGAAAAALATVTRELPVYTGLIEAARANNRQGFPVGAAYLRQASNLLNGTILPAADQLYTTQARRLGEDYSTGTSTGWLATFIAAMCISVALLLVAQRYLFAVSHRILNVAAVVGTVLLVVLAVWGVVALTREGDALASAQRNGSDSVEVLSAARILVSRAQTDESLTLVARGGDTTDPADFSAVIGALGQPGGSAGLMREVHALSRRAGTASAATELDRALAAYLAQHAQIVALEQQGLTTQANLLAAGLATGGRTPADRVSEDLVAQARAAQSRFEHDAADATSALAGLAVAIPLVFALAALLTMFGLRQRAMEYR